MFAAVTHNAQIFNDDIFQKEHGLLVTFAERLHLADGRNKLPIDYPPPLSRVNLQFRRDVLALQSFFDDLRQFFIKFFDLVGSHADPAAGHGREPVSRDRNIFQGFNDVDLRNAAQRPDKFIFCFCKMIVGLLNSSAILPAISPKIPLAMFIGSEDQLFVLEGIFPRLS